MFSMVISANVDALVVISVKPMYVNGNTPFGRNELPFRLSPFELYKPYFGFIHLKTKLNDVLLLLWLLAAIAGKICPYCTRRGRQRTGPSSRQNAKWREAVSERFGEPSAEIAIL